MRHLFYLIDYPKNEDEITMAFDDVDQAGCQMSVT